MKYSTWNIFYCVFNICIHLHCIDCNKTYNNDTKIEKTSKLK